MPRKRKIDTITQIHGKEETFQPTTLDQIWGDSGFSKYKTLDEEVYLNNLKEMTKADLHTHASSLGIIPVDDRERLQKRLLQEFRQHVAAYRKPLKQPTPSRPTPEIMKIMSEGR